MAARSCRHWRPCDGRCWSRRKHVPGVTTTPIPSLVAAYRTPTAFPFRAPVPHFSAADRRCVCDTECIVGTQGVECKLVPHPSCATRLCNNRDRLFVRTHRRYGDGLGGTASERDRVRRLFGWFGRLSIAAPSAVANICARKPVGYQTDFDGSCAVRPQLGPDRRLDRGRGVPTVPC